MQTKPRIEMIFYSHPWSIHLLGETLLQVEHRNVLVEVATESKLEYVCGCPGQARSGVTALLTDPARAKLLAMAQSFPLLSAPIILAARPQLNRQLLIHALSVLETRPSDLDHVYLLCHVADAADFKALFPIVDQFHILWDPADYPSEDLLACAQALKVTESLGDGRWGGFSVQNHWLRNSPDIAHNREQLERLLEQSVARG